MARDGKQVLILLPLNKLGKIKTQGRDQDGRQRQTREEKAKAEAGNPSERGQLMRLGRETVRKRRVREQGKSEKGISSR